MGELMRYYWLPAFLSEEIPRPIVRRCGCAFGRRPGRLSRFPGVEWACLVNTAPIAARRCSSAVTKSAAWLHLSWLEI